MIDEVNDIHTYLKFACNSSLFITIIKWSPCFWISPPKKNILFLSWGWGYITSRQSSNFLDFDYKIFNFLPLLVLVLLTSLPLEQMLSWNVHDDNTSINPLNLVAWSFKQTFDMRPRSRTVSWCLLLLAFSRLP